MSGECDDCREHIIEGAFNKNDKDLACLLKVCLPYVCLLREGIDLCLAYLRDIWTLL